MRSNCSSPTQPSRPCNRYGKPFRSSSTGGRNFIRAPGDAWREVPRALTAAGEEDVRASQIPLFWQLLLKLFHLLKQIAGLVDALDHLVRCETQQVRILLLQALLDFPPRDRCRDGGKISGPQRVDIHCRLVLVVLAP